MLVCLELMGLGNFVNPVRDIDVRFYDGNIVCCSKCDCDSVQLSDS